MQQGRREYEEPRIEKREKLSDVTGVAMTGVTDGRVLVG